MTVANRSRPRRARAIASRLLIYAVLAAVLVLSLAPTLWVILSSFKTGNQIFSGGSLWPEPFTVQGYIDAFAQVRLHEYVLNTLLYAGGGTVGAVAVGFLAAYPLARYRFRGKALLVALFSLALAVPLVALATPEFFVMRQLGLFDSRIGMVVFYAALMFPLSFVILRSSLLSLPPALEEAALMDGAGYFSILTRIVFPLSRPAIATVSVVSFVLIWNEFFFANLLTISRENQNVQLALAGFKSQFGFNVTGAISGATVVLLVPVVIYLLLQRQVIAGLTAGAVK